MSLPFSLSSELRRHLAWLKKAIGPVVQDTDADADDIVQEAMLRAVAMKATVVRHPRALLITIARRVSIDDARKVRARGGTALAFDDLPEETAPWTSPDQETTLLAKQIILGLPPLYRDVFILNRFMGLTYVEIAGRLGVSVKTIEYRMSRALALCEAALRD